MASWMVHLQVADRLLDCLPGVAQTEFVMGNIAPDSGVPNEDGTAFMPDSRISHFRVYEEGKVRIDVQAFLDRYFTKEQQKNNTVEENSFYLGYLAHLLTDEEWAGRLYRPGIERHFQAYQEDKDKLIGAMKKDWYDLDFLYLKKHPDFRAFCIYETAKGFVNSYMDIFSPDAFDSRRASIAGFYRTGRENLEREYSYLTEQEYEKFVKNCAETVLQKLNESVLYIP